MNYVYWTFAHASMLLNVLTGGLPYESLCARFDRLSKEHPNHYVASVSFFIVKWMHLLDPRHCEKAGKCRDLIHEKLRL